MSPNVVPQGIEPLSLDRTQLVSFTETPFVILEFTSSLADGNGLPVDAEAVELLSLLQQRGLTFGAWRTQSNPGRAYVAVSRRDEQRFYEIVESLQNEGVIEDQQWSRLVSRLMTASPGFDGRAVSKQVIRQDGFGALVVAILGVLWLIAGAVQGEWCMVATAFLPISFAALIWRGTLWHRRHAQVQCPSCGYPYGSADICTECGASRIGQSQSESP